MVAPFLTESEGAVVIDVHAQPRASRSRVVGEHDGRLKVQLAAPPVEGAANEALIELFADLLGVPRRHLALVAGTSGRRKRVRVAGVTLAHVERALAGATR